VNREQRADDPAVDRTSSEYEPPIVEDLESEGEAATVSVTGGIMIISLGRSLAEPTDNPPAADGV
jgi:hypothetical protein